MVHFDSSVPAADTVTVGTCNPTWATSGKDGFVTDRTVTIAATGGAGSTLRIYMGDLLLDTGSAGSGSINVTIDLAAEALALLGSGNERHVFHSNIGAALFVVSDQGGFDQCLIGQLQNP
jgi:hypothetical protein